MVGGSEEVTYDDLMLLKDKIAELYPHSCVTWDDLTQKKLDALECDRVRMLSFFKHCLKVVEARTKDKPHA